MSRGGVEREGEKESQVGSSPSAQSPTQGSIPWIMRSWPEPKSRVGCSTDWCTQALLVVLFLIFFFLRNFHAAFHCFYQLMFPSLVHKGGFTQSMPTLTISCLFDNRHSDRCEMISRGGFDLYSLVIRDVVALYMYLLSTCICICTPSLEKCLFRSFAHCKIDYLGFFAYWAEEFLTYFDINLLSNVICKYFLPFYRLSFYSVFFFVFCVFFAMWKLFSLI